ncbi:hypothetical protein QTO34_013003 [Cnephaeus nilssonii]|uniref:C2H2-type domain-containing protein n=1 Tax=Cnephaeus nilssonii TaxID=3371016 RepID=A0AA40HB64_CNENI|nr:hypothetical protein QTO34_013003 [Eptesicus nilssonii]
MCYLSFNNLLSSHIGLKLYLCQEYEENPYKCKEPEKAFKHHQHIRRHEGSPSGKAFHYSTSLRNHERTHIGEKSYECKQCGKAFSSLSSLGTHKRNHDGQNRFGSVDRASVCGLKGPRFDSGQGHVPWLRAHPRIHERMHTGENPMNVVIMVKLSLIQLPSNVMKELIIKKNPIDVSRWESLPLSSLIESMKEHNVEKSPMTVSNVGKLSDIPLLFEIMKECTLGRNPMNVSNVGKPSVVPHIFKDIKDSWWKEAS